MNGSLPANDGPVVDMDMPSQLHIVGNDGVRTDLAVMSDVHIGHDPVVVAQAGHSDILNRAGVHRHILPEHVAVTDFQPGGLAAILFVLRHAPDRAEPVKHIVGTDGGVAVDDAMRTHLGARPNGDMRANQAVGADFNVVSEHRAGRDDGCGVDACRHISLPPRESRTSAWLRPRADRPPWPWRCTCRWND